ISNEPVAVAPARRSVSIFRKRVQKFRRLKRGYYSFLIIVFAYLVSFLLPFLFNDKALLVHYKDEWYVPMITYQPAVTFDQATFGEPNYRQLKETFKRENAGDWVLMPPYPYSPTESLLDLPGSPPHPPSGEHFFGTDDRARDVFARLAYGF